MNFWKPLRCHGAGSLDAGSSFHGVVWLSPQKPSTATGLTGQGPHQPEPILWPPNGEQGRQEMEARFNQESRSSGKLLVMRHVCGQADKSIHRSEAGSGLMRIIRVSHSPAKLEEVQSDATGLRSSWEVYRPGSRPTCLQLSCRLISHSVAQRLKTAELTQGFCVWVEAPCEASQGHPDLLVHSGP